MRCDYFLSKEPCTNCGKLMDVLFNQDDLMRGWLCPCGKFEKAILRERKYTKEHYKTKAGCGEVTSEARQDEGSR